jgi:hypothetical protein
MAVVDFSKMVNRRTQRDRDTAAFLTHLMYDFYSDLYRYIHSELGFRGSIVCSNWKTADDAILGPLDKWANSACDVMDRHSYYSGPHRGDRAGYMVAAKDVYSDASLLRFESPEEGGLQKMVPNEAVVDPLINNKPSLLSEVNWTWPNRFRAEAPVLTAAYGCMQSTDAVLFFVSSSPNWEQTLSKFSIADPMIMGQFPAAALLFRQALVAEAPVVAKANLSLSDALSLHGSPLRAGAHFDPFRTGDLIGRVLRKDTSTLEQALLPLVGATALNITAQPSASNLISTTPYIDRTHNAVTSVTHELMWDWKQGLLTVDTSKVQAAVGFFEPGRTVTLREAQFSLRNEYAAATIVPLDNKPLSYSRRILLQIVTEATNTAWASSGGTQKSIANAGHDPIIVRNVIGSVRLLRADAAAMKVTALDHSGLPRSVYQGGADAIALLPDALYYLITSVDE